MKYLILIIMVLNAFLIFQFGITIATFTAIAISGLLIAISLLSRQLGKSDQNITIRRCRDGLIILFLIWLISFIAVQFQIINGMNNQNFANNYDYIIVLGAAVRGEEPSLSLKQRLNKTLEVYRNNPGATYIVSGGQGAGEDISEAEAMRIYLVENGLPNDQIIMEDRSTSTAENIEYSIRLMNRGNPHGKKVLIITSDYHLYRALEVAKKNKIFAQGVSSATPYSIKLNYMIREYYAVIKYALFE